MRRELTGEEILIAAEEMRRLAEWEAAMAWARTLYGDQEVAVTVEVESTYDDEGGYDDSIEDVGVRGKDKAFLLPDPDAEKSKELLDEERERIASGETEPLDWEDRTAVAERLEEILDDLDMYDLGANEVVLNPVDGTTTYCSWDKPTVRFGTLYVDDNQPKGSLYEHLRELRSDVEAMRLDHPIEVVDGYLADIVERLNVAQSLAESPPYRPDRVTVNVHIEGGQYQGDDAPDWIDVVIHDDMDDGHASWSSIPEEDSRARE